MITRPSGRIPEERTNMRGGDGTVVMESYLEKSLFPKHFRVFCEIVLEPGCSIGEHTHEGECEVFRITEGEGVYGDNGVEKTVSAGDVTVCFSGESHSIANRSDKTLKLFAAVITE